MPVLPITSITPGWHEATIEGFTYKSSNSNANPMVEVEITLDTGELTSVYLMVTQNGSAFDTFLHACGQTDVAEQIRRKKNPSFDLETLIGTRLRVYIPGISGFIKFFTNANAKRS